MVTGTSMVHMSCFAATVLSALVLLPLCDAYPEIWVGSSLNTKKLPYVPMDFNGTIMGSRPLIDREGDTDNPFNCTIWGIPISYTAGAAYKVSCHLGISKTITLGADAGNISSKHLIAFKNPISGIGGYHTDEEGKVYYGTWFAPKFGTGDIKAGYSCANVYGTVYTKEITIREILPSVAGYTYIRQKECASLGRTSVLFEITRIFDGLEECRRMCERSAGCKGFDVYYGLTNNLMCMGVDDNCLLITSTPSSTVVWYERDAGPVKASTEAAPIMPTTYRSRTTEIQPVRPKILNLPSTITGYQQAMSVSVSCEAESSHQLLYEGLDILYCRDECEKLMQCTGFTVKQVNSIWRCESFATSCVLNDEEGDGCIAYKRKAGAVRLTQATYEVKCFKEKQNWITARGICDEWGYLLAMIRSELEQVALEVAIHQNNISNSSWIGLSHDGKWWRGENVSYTNYGPGQHPGNKSLCAYLNLLDHAFWYEQDCEALSQYCCVDGTSVWPTRTTKTSNVATSETVNSVTSSITSTKTTKTTLTSTTKTITTTTITLMTVTSTTRTATTTITTMAQTSMTITRTTNTSMSSRNDAFTSGPPDDIREYFRTMGADCVGGVSKTFYNPAKDPRRCRGKCETWDQCAGFAYIQVQTGQWKCIGKSVGCTVVNATNTSVWYAAKRRKLATSSSSSTSTSSLEPAVSSTSLTVTPETTTSSSSDSDYTAFCYFGQVTMAAAKISCELKGLILAVVKTQHQQKRVEESCNYVLGNFWVGLIKDDAGKVRWLDGSKVQYQYFGDDQPDGGGNEKCFALNGKHDWFRWYDFSCDSQYLDGYVCSGVIAPAPKTSLTTTITSSSTVSTTLMPSDEPRPPHVIGYTAEPHSDCTGGNENTLVDKAKSIQECLQKCETWKSCAGFNFIYLTSTRAFRCVGKTEACSIVSDRPGMIWYRRNDGPVAAENAGDGGGNHTIVMITVATLCIVCILWATGLLTYVRSQLRRRMANQAYYVNPAFVPEEEDV
eukprot:m.112888 g.112888  ORF g.112888 m.112888 type:complete len:1009 (+) comp14109_c0_seq1:299-3325(+)